MATRIGVVTLVVGDEFQRQTARGIELAQAYCARHGYDYHLHTEWDRKDNPKPIAWFKLLALKQHLPDYDWLWWLDTDTIITDLSQPLDRWLDTDADYVFSLDPVCDVNSGVWFCRNSPGVAEQLQTWFDGPERRRWWEQAYINETLGSVNYRIAPDLAGILRFGKQAPRERYFIEGRTWILHLAGRQKFGKEITPAMEYYHRRYHSGPHESVEQKVDRLTRIDKNQMTAAERLPIAKQIDHLATHLRAPNVLVFGVGLDTTLWRELNPRGRTVFLEDNPKWLKRFGATQFETVPVVYAEDDPAELLPLPKSIATAKWDVVIVDGPANSGRRQAIYTASQLTARHVYVHDADWPSVDAASREFLGDTFTEVERMRHYVRR
jgi:hypothetical protein